MMICYMKDVYVAWRTIPRPEGWSPRVGHGDGEAGETFHVHAATVSALSCVRGRVSWWWCVLVVSSVGEHSLTSSVVWVQRRRRDGLKLGRGQEEATAEDVMVEGCASDYCRQGREVGGDGSEQRAARRMTDVDGGLTKANRRNGRPMLGKAMAAGKTVF